MGLRLADRTCCAACPACAVAAVMNVRCIARAVVWRPCPSSIRPAPPTFLEGPSTVFWVAVVACTVVIRPSRMPAVTKGTQLWVRFRCLVALGGSYTAPVLQTAKMAGLQQRLHPHKMEVPLCVPSSTAAAASNCACQRTKGVVHCLGQGRPAVGGAAATLLHASRQQAQNIRIVQLSAPKASFTTLATGARQLVVHEALDSTVTEGSYFSWFTPCDQDEIRSISRKKWAAFATVAAACRCGDNAEQKALQRSSPPRLTTTNMGASLEGAEMTTCKAHK